jgi:P-type Cu2+ transporter
VDTLFFKISGMHCISCAQTIEEIVKKHNEFVNDVRVFFPLNLLIVKAKNNIATKEFTKILTKEIKKNGYFISKMDLSEIATIPKKFYLHFIIRLTLITIISLLLHSHLYFNTLIFLPLLVILSFKYFVYMKNEVTAKRLGMGTFISIALTMSLISSFINLFLHTNPYKVAEILSSYSMILFFVELGKGIGELFKMRFISEALKELDVLHKKILVKNEDNYEEKLVKDVKEGDIILLEPGKMLYFDGKVLYGEGYMNEAVSSGESEPVYKKSGTQVISGSYNMENPLHIEVTNSFMTSKLGIIWLTILQSLSEKGTRQYIVEKLLKYFIYLELAIIGLAFIYHIPKGILAALERSSTIALLSCPCALGIATPLALAVAILSAYSKKILIRNPNVLETFKNSKYLLVDKTGTLTYTTPVVNYFKLTYSDQKIIQLLYTLTGSSVHPKSKALNTYLKSNFPWLSFYTTLIIENIPAKGIATIFENEKYFLGNFSLLAEYYSGVSQLEEEFVDRDLYFFTATKIYGVFDFEEKIHPNAKELFSFFKNYYTDVAILSGDKSEKVESCAKQLGIEKVYASKTSLEKLEIIRGYKKAGGTIFIGDGINDALAIKEADIGISLGSGADITKISADIVLLDNNLEKLHYLQLLSRKTVLAIKLNLLWAFLYNIIFLPLGFGIISSISISPALASILMSASSILVTLNSIVIFKVGK